MPRKKEAALRQLRTVPVPNQAEAEHGRGRAFGNLERISVDGRVFVRLSNSNVPQPALIATSDSPEALLDAVRRRARVLVDLVEGSLVVLALVRERLDPDLLVSRADEVAPERIELRARQGVLIACGAARIELRADGAVTLKGNQVDTVSQGTIRLDGSDIKLN